MTIKSVFDADFAKYGKVLNGYNVDALLAKLEEKTPKPADAVIYEPGDADLEAIMGEVFSVNAYGGMPIQIGYCNGYNTKLNCREWHRGSELTIPANDMVLLLATLSDVKDGKLDTSKVEAFYAPKGTVVNSVGAGDSMVAGFIAGWNEKHEYEHALKMGISCGSASAFSEDLATFESAMGIFKNLS